MNGTPETQRNGRHHADPASVAKASRPMTPAMALVWRQWRETRMLIAAFLAFAAAFAVGLAVNQMTPLHFGGEELAEIQFIGLGFLGGMLGLILVVGQFNSRRHSVLFASQWLTLPISTMRLAGILLGYRLVVLTVFASAALLIQWIVGQSAGHEPIQWIAENLQERSFAVVWSFALMVFGLATFFVWVAFPVHRAFAPALIIAIYAAGIYVALHVDASDLVRPAWMLPVALFCLAAAPWGLAAQRQGRWVALEGLGPEFAGSRLLPPFQSADHALRWYETRLFVRHLVWGGIVMIALANAAIVIDFGLPEIGWSPLSAFIGSLAGAAAAAIGVGACALGGPLQALRRREIWQPFTLPVSVRRIASARLNSTAKGVGVLSGVIAAAVGAAYLFSTGDTSLRSVAMLLTACAVTVPILLWSLYQAGAAMYCYFVLCMTLDRLIFRLITDTNTESHGNYMIADGQWLVPALLLLVVATAIYGLLRGYLTKRWLIGATALVPIFAAVAILSITATGIASSWAATWGAGLTLLFLYPLFLVPTYLGWMRTR